MEKKTTKTTNKQEKDGSSVRERKRFTGKSGPALGISITAWFSQYLLAVVAKKVEGAYICEPPVSLSKLCRLKFSHRCVPPAEEDTLKFHFRASLGRTILHQDAMSSAAQTQVALRTKVVNSVLFTVRDIVHPRPHLSISPQSQAVPSHS